MFMLNSKRFGPEVQFSPLDISDLEGWWDAQDASTITGSPTAVTQWDDKSGNGFDLTPAGANNDPAQLEVGGKNMLSFDSANDENLSSNSTSLNPVTSSFTLIAVWRANNAIGDQIIVGRGDGGPRYDLFFSGASGNLQGGINDNVNNFSALSDSTINYDDGTVRISAIMLDQPANDFFLFGNDDATALQSDLGASAGTINPNAQGHDFFISGFDSGPGSTIWAPMTGEVGEVLMYHRALSAQERADLWGYLTSRWGI